MVYWFTRFASWLAGRVPRPARLAIAGPLTMLIYYLWPAKRHVTIANMAQILGVAPDDPRARRLARNCWLNYGRYISDFFYLPNSTPEALLAHLQDTTPAPGAYARMDEALAHGKGLLIATPHFGAWDVAGVLVGAHTPLHVLVDSFPDPRMDKLIQQQRRDLGMEVLYVEKSPRAILRILQKNGTVAIVADRPLLAGEGTPITFFGKRCYVPGGVAQLSLLSGAPVMPGYSWYGAGHAEEVYYGLVDEPIYPQPTGDRRADTQAITQRIYDSFERMIGKYPDQWAMFRPFWPDEETKETEAAVETTEAAESGASGGTEKASVSDETAAATEGQRA